MPSRLLQHEFCRCRAASWSEAGTATATNLATISGAAVGEGGRVGAVPALADLALGTGDLPTVVVDLEVVPGAALVAAVPAGRMAAEWPGDGDLVFAGGLFQVGQGGVAGVDQVLGGQQLAWGHAGVDAGQDLSVVGGGRGGATSEWNFWSVPRNRLPTHTLDSAREQLRRGERERAMDLPGGGRAQGTLAGSGPQRQVGLYEAEDPLPSTTPRPRCPCGSGRASPRKRSPRTPRSGDRRLVSESQQAFGVEVADLRTVGLAERGVVEPGATPRRATGQGPT